MNPYLLHSYNWCNSIVPCCFDICPQDKAYKPKPMQVNSCLSDTLYKPPMRYSPYSHWQYPQDNQDKLIDLCCFDTDPLDKEHSSIAPCTIQRYP